MRGVTGEDNPVRLLEVISTRTPHAGSDAEMYSFASDYFLFQPALPMRGVTAILCAKFTASINI